MKKKLIEINYDKISDGDIAVFQHERWTVIPKAVFLNDLYKNHNSLVENTASEIKRLEDTIADLQSQIDKLKQDILYILGENDDVEESEPEPEEEPENEENEQDA